MVEGRQLRFSERALHRQVALEREFRSLRIERLAVVEFDVWAQLDRDLLAVGGSFMRQRELRHDVELFVDVEQLVAKCREYDAADICARQRRVDKVRDLSKAAPPAGLGVDTREQRKQQRCLDN